MTKSTLGELETVKLVVFNATVEGKVDTGATTSSLHADKIRIDGDFVIFSAPYLTNNDTSIRMPKVGEQEVSSADGGTQTRPMIELDVEIGGKVLERQVFNLNDRSTMDQQMLIGVNVLEAGEFVVDVAKDVEPEMEQDVLEHSEPQTKERSEIIAEVIKVLHEADITLAEIVTHMKTKIIQDMEI